MPSDRSVLLINATAPAASLAAQGAGADVLAAVAAALAATYMVAKDAHPQFASASLKTAMLLYQEAVLLRPQANITFEALLPEGQQQRAAEYADGGAIGVQDFGSSSVLDDMALAAAWLGKATGAFCGCCKAMRGIIMVLLLIRCSSCACLTWTCMLGE